MKKGSKITDYDAGTSFGMAGCALPAALKASRDADIAKYAHSQVHNAGTGSWQPHVQIHGKEHASWIITTVIGTRKKAEPALVTVAPAVTARSGVKSPGDKANDLLSRYTYEVGNFTHKPRDYNKIATQISQDALRRC